MTRTPGLPFGSDVRDRLRGSFDLLDQCAGHLRALLESILQETQVPLIDADLLQAAPIEHGVPQAVLQRVLQDLQTVTTSHDALLPGVRRGLPGDLATLEPLATGTRLIDVNSLRSSTKLVLIVLLLVLEEMVLGFPGGRRSPSLRRSLRAPATSAGKTRSTCSA